MAQSRETPNPSKSIIPVSTSRFVSRAKQYSVVYHISFQFISHPRSCKFIIPCVPLYSIHITFHITVLKKCHSPHVRYPVIGSGLVGKGQHHLRQHSGLRHRPERWKTSQIQPLVEMDIFRHHWGRCVQHILAVPISKHV